MKKCAVIGFPVEHSLSPKMHNSAYNALGLEFVYEKILVDPKDLSCFLKRVRTGEFVGISVTVPFKESILEFADILTPAAEEISAANTLYFKNSKLVADNTDYFGFWQALMEVGDFKNSSILVCGAGGAARGVLYALKINNFQKVYILNRTESKAKQLAEEFEFELYTGQAVDVIVNTTSSKEFLLPNEMILGAKFVFDINYGETVLLNLAKSQNIPNCDGKKMLLYQGIRQFEIFTGHKAPKEVMFNSISNN